MFHQISYAPTRSQRYPTKERGVVSIAGSDGLHKVTMIDLSFTGACLEWKSTSANVMKGDLVNVTIYLFNINKKHHIKAKIAWADSRRIGIQFSKSFFRVMA